MPNKSVMQHSGREFNTEEIALIKETTETYRNLSQKELASTICELIGWVTHDGKPKTVQCVEFIRRLEQEGLIRLPPIATAKIRPRRPKEGAGRSSLDGIDMSEVTKCGDINLKIVRPGNGLARWRAYVSNFHVLGDPQVYGSQLRYLVTSDGRDLGCLLFSASSWALAQREEWIGWTPEEKKSRLHLILNNSRFLLFPWVRVKNLASRTLSMAARQIQADWLVEYCYAPVLLETFVDAPYKGTSYKASNWIYLGETKGRGRNDRHTERLLTKKAIYVLPLRRDFRAVLKGEKPYKAVDPDDF